MFIRESCLGPCEFPPEGATAPPALELMRRHAEQAFDPTVEVRKHSVRVEEQLRHQNLAGDIMIGIG